MYRLDLTRLLHVAPYLSQPTWLRKVGYHCATGRVPSRARPKFFRGICGALAPYSSDDYPHDGRIHNIQCSSAT